MILNMRKGSAVTDVVISAAIIVFAVLPVFSGIIEKYILLNKAQIIKDAVDMTNISVYNALNTGNLGKVNVNIDYTEAERIYRSLLAKNLNLDESLYPLRGSLAESKVRIESLVIYSEGFPAICPDGINITRTSVHSCISTPVKPSLYRQLLLNFLHKDYVDIKVHVDSEIPVNN